jgi:predicted ribosome-associated RNA-binding protein Tma20
MNEKNTIARDPLRRNTTAHLQNELPSTTEISPQTEIASTSTTTTTEKIDIVNVNGESIVFNGEGDVKINGGHISVKDGTITIEGMHG